MADEGQEPATLGEWERAQYAPVQAPGVVARRKNPRPLILVIAGLVLIGLLGAGLAIGAHRWKQRSSVSVKIGTALPPLPAPVDMQAIEELPPEVALQRNEEIPLVQNGLQPAGTFMLPVEREQGLSYRAALDCMTAAVYYEANSEPPAGQRAVAQVILNRMRHPAFPKSVCGVVYQGAERRTGCQFTFACDGSLARKPSLVGWTRARLVASAALGGWVERSVGMATHYHADYVVPSWAHSLDKIAIVGRHIFYRWRGHWGLRAAFTGRYAGENMELTPAGIPEGLEPLTQPTDGFTDPALPQSLPPSLLPPPVRPRIDETPAGQPLRVDETKPSLTADQDKGTLIVQ